MSDQEFTHLDPMGRARMVDVSHKEPTHRRAVARCKVTMRPETITAIVNREVKKGDVLAVARAWPGSWRPSAPRTPSRSVIR